MALRDELPRKPGRKPQRAIFTENLNAPGYEDVPPLRRKLMIFLENQGVPPAYADALMLSLSEAMSNLVKHPKHKAQRVRVQVSVDPGGLEMDIADNSTPFATFDAECNRTLPPSGNIEDVADHGYGLPLIRKLHQSVSYQRMHEAADGFNHLRIRDDARAVYAREPEKAVTGERRKTVFLIDDDPLFLKAASRILATRYDVAAFSRPAQALAVMQKGLPDMVISDYRMPGMNGAELRAAMTAIRGGDNIPFIFLSAHAEKENSPEILRLGIDDFIRKPVEDDRLLSLAERLIARSEQLRQSWESRFHKDLNHPISTPLPASWRGWSFVTCNRMADAGGGDFILHHAGNDKMTFFLADVMGHGAKAKFFAYAYAGYMRGLFNLPSGDDAPPAFLGRLSAALHGDPLLESILLSCQGFRLDAEGGFSAASAGHPHAYILKSDRTIPLAIEGPPPGILPDTSYAEKNMALGDGDILCLATDGFFDVYGPGNLPQAGGENLQRTGEKIWRAFEKRRAASTLPDDDATLILAQYRTSDDRRPQ